MEPDDPVKDAVDQTLAAERLEGWQPTDDHVAALIALARGDTTFGEYLSPHLVRYASVQGRRRDYRRVLRRHRPYLIPGTTMLRNNFGVVVPDQLRDLEFIATAARITQWHCRIADGEVAPQQVGFRIMHQHVFADCYPWAGHYRITELRRGDDVFAPQSGVVAAMERLEDALQRLAVDGRDLDGAGLGYQFARLYADYNQVHPFREGNGRTATLALATVAALCRRRLDLTVLRRSEWYAASRDSMPFRRDGQANHRPFLPLFHRALTL